uniref:Uncharacterized protein n=1 Tax=Candidatus Kentrum sp. DK TaxID=2126562 RepID=A0A450TJV4_9GAMM|nr:MAG: hypothetical protein BECKDK2373C_GA0170839_11693 [Candidatus Kentron sp. DK]
MIPDTARYHGSFFVLLFESIDRPVTVERLTKLGTGYYLLDGRIPVYLKLSTKRKGPWGFNFFRSHQEMQEKILLTYGECFTCLICGHDGVVGLSMDEFRQVLDGNFEEQESVSVRRKLKNMYQVKGRDGTLDYRLSRRSIFDKLKLKIENGTK